MQKRASDIAAIISSASLDELPALIRRYKEDPRSQVSQSVKQAEKRIEHNEYLIRSAKKKYAFDRSFCSKGIVVGIDEVGRGPLAGPLTVCAVALPDEPLILGLDDSKRLSESSREALSKEIRTRALGVGISFVEPQTIDALGMSICIRRAMSEALELTGIEADCVLIDGNPVHIHPLEHCVIKGDAQSASIAAASIVAKVARDAFMCSIDAQFPQYAFSSNKGYGSKEHISAIRHYGLCPYHRVSFCGNFLETLPLFLDDDFSS